MAMANVFPTKSNLLQSKRSLALAKVGFELMDKKRNIMLREMMNMMDEVNAIQNQIDTTFSEAYSALQKADFATGQEKIQRIVSLSVYPDDISIRFRSVMGVELPVVKLEPQKAELSYGFAQTTADLDDAYIKFIKVKQLTATLTAIENSVYKLASAIKQTQKRANALKNIVIPRLEETVYFITSYLEEKERESFTVLKVIKAKK